MGHLNKSGFTIVELLVVIVVVGILSVVSVVVYSGVQNRAHDTKRRSDVSSIAKAIKLYSIDHDGDTLGVASGCGKQGSGYWMGVYAPGVSFRDCLVAAGHSSLANVQDPSGCDGTGACSGNLIPRYMKLDCIKDGQPSTYVLAQLTTEPQNAGFMESICDNTLTIPGWGRVGVWDERYGINYAVKV